LLIINNHLQLTLLYYLYLFLGQAVEFIPSTNSADPAAMASVQIIFGSGHNCLHRDFLH